MISSCADYDSLLLHHVIYYVKILDIAAGSARRRCRFRSSCMSTITKRAPMIIQRSQAHCNDAEVLSERGDLFRPNPLVVKRSMGPGRLAFPDSALRRYNKDVPAGPCGKYRDIN